MALDFLLQVSIAFVGGLAIATSPCLFPLLPLFLMKNLQSEESRLRSVLVTGILALGILASLAIYIILTSIILGLGLLFIDAAPTLARISYVLIIILGIIIASHTVREKLRLANLSMRTAPDNPKGLVGVFMVGFTYTMVAVPCTGSILLGIVPIISAQANPILILLLYLLLCFGVLIPYLAIAVVTGEARMKIASRLANSARTIEIIVGIFLIILGIYLIVVDAFPNINI